MAHYLGELTESNMKNLQALVDSNSVIGKEIVTPDGTVILPVSRVSFGFGSGGGDLPSSQKELFGCLLYTSPSPRDRQKSRMPSSA